MKKIVRHFENALALAMEELLGKASRESEVAVALLAMAYELDELAIAMQTCATYVAERCNGYAEQIAAGQFATTAPSRSSTIEDMTRMEAQASVLHKHLFAMIRAVHGDAFSKQVTKAAHATRREAR